MYPKYTINAKNKAVLTILILMGTDSILYGILYQVMFVYLVCFSEPAGATQKVWLNKIILPAVTVDYNI